MVVFVALRLQIKIQNFTLPMNVKVGDVHAHTWRSRVYSPVAAALLKSVSSLWEVSQFFTLTIRFPSPRIEVRIANTSAWNQHKKPTKASSRARNAAPHLLPNGDLDGAVFKSTRR